jgi:hypothetical protein
MNDLKYKNLINDDILNSITLPVLIAFGNEFQNSNLSLKFYLMNKENIKTEFIWIKNLKLNKDYIKQFIFNQELESGLNEIELNTWMQNFGNIYQFIQLYDSLS